jgi:hypothetical protein
MKDKDMAVLGIGTAQALGFSIFTYFNIYVQFLLVVFKYLISKSFNNYNSVLK